MTQPNQTQPTLTSFFDTKEIMKLILQKLSSQALLYSIAIIILVMVSYLMFRKEGMYITILIAAIFMITLVAYLFFEQVKKVQNNEPNTISSLLKNRITDIQGSSAFEVKLWVSPAPKNGITSRDIAVLAAEKSHAFSIGDIITVCFTSSRDGYLTLLNVGTSGRLTILFPNKLHPDNHVKANELYTLPASDDGFEYQLQGPPGLEKLKAIVTIQPMSLVESDFSNEGSLFKTSNAGVAARDIAMLKKKVETISSSEWAEASWEFRVS